MRASLRTALRRLHAEEAGQSLVVLSLSMVVMLGMAALGIDVASWYAKHHQTQVVADSAALAAANCLAHPNGGPSGASLHFEAPTRPTRRTWRSPTQQRTGVTITASQVVINTTTDTVKVNPSATTPSAFASIAGIQQHH